MAVRISIWRSQPNDEIIRRCLGSDEFEYLKCGIQQEALSNFLHVPSRYIRKLTQRMSDWQKILKKNKLSQERLRVVSTFRTQGLHDPPHSEYSHLVEIQNMIDALIPPDMQRTMFTFMLSEKLTIARELDPTNRL